MVIRKIELANIKLAQNVIANNLAVQWIEWAYAHTGSLSEWEYCILNNSLSQYPYNSWLCLNNNSWDVCDNWKTWQYFRYIKISINKIWPDSNWTWYNVCSIVDYTRNAWWVAQKPQRNQICAVIDVKKNNESSWEWNENWDG